MTSARGCLILFNFVKYTGTTEAFKLLCSILLCENFSKLQKRRSIGFHICIAKTACFSSYCIYLNSALLLQKADRPGPSAKRWRGLGPPPKLRLDLPPRCGGLLRFFALQKKAKGGGAKPLPRQKVQSGALWCRSNNPGRGQSFVALGK